MKTYCVILSVKISDYEKIITKLVNAPNKKLASSKALLNECHSIDFALSDNGVYDCGGEFYYSVLDCKEVHPDHIQCLKNYFFN